MVTTSPSDRTSFSRQSRLGGMVQTYDWQGQTLTVA